MDRSELLRRLRSRRVQLSESLSQQIHHIIEVDASIQAIEGRDIHVPDFPLQNPFRDVPSRRIDHDTYLLIARQIVGGQAPEHIRVPGAERPALLRELEQRRREVRRIITTLDRQLEELEAQTSPTETNARASSTLEIRDNLRAELQFYIDLTEALNYTPTRVTPEERTEANQRARNWIENISRRRNDRR
jgi:hypothetical protein